MTRKKFREKDKKVVLDALSSKLPSGAKMALIQPTEEWAQNIQDLHQALTGKSLEQLRREQDYLCPKEAGRVKDCEGCDRYQQIVECSKREYKDEETGEIKKRSAPCDYMFDSGDLCVNCPSAQLLFVGIDCPCPAPGIYRHGEAEELQEQYDPEEYEDYEEW